MIFLYFKTFFMTGWESENGFRLDKNGTSKPWTPRVRFSSLFPNWHVLQLIHPSTGTFLYFCAIENLSPLIVGKPETNLTNSKIENNLIFHHSFFSHSMLIKYRCCWIWFLLQFVCDCLLLNKSEIFRFVGF